MGPLGVPEMMFIFILALVLFGPKKLPEIGRTVGKAISEFRRASSELQSTFTNELQNLERETESIKQATVDYHPDTTYNYDYSSYESQYGENGVAQIEAPATDPSSESASATQGAESTSAEVPEGAIARGAEIEAPAAGAPAEGLEHSSGALVSEGASTPAGHET
jgi:TatA/E family protein of Tat protein translocase